MSDAKEIAMRIFPPEWKEVGDFKIDNNASRRHCAEAVANYFLEVLKRESTANAVMHAFYRREHGQEPDSSEASYLRAHMGTALLAYEFQLKEKLHAEGCEHEYGLRLCDQCCVEQHTY